MESPVLFVIFGVSGDLSRRKLLPALYRLIEQKGLPQNYQVVGVSRQLDYTVDTLIHNTMRYLPEADGSVLAGLKDHITIVHNTLSTPKDAETLRETLSDYSAQLGNDVTRIYYLSVPPNAFKPLVTLLGDAEHAKPFANERNTPRILVEKPFGYDQGTAQELIAIADSKFGEGQIYRIDHYLARETAQNILVFRFQNALFESVWNDHHIAHINVVTHESIDIEGRASFYEQTGAVRDIIQSHLLQVAALIMMQRPAVFDSASIHEAKLQLLSSIIPAKPGTSVRGQYKGYKQAVGNNDSTTETFARLDLTVDNDQWRNTRLTLETGKALNEHCAYVEVVFRPYAETATPNTLIFRLQPTEGITLQVQAKQPGPSNTTKTVEMEFDYGKSFTSKSAQPYERVVRDAIKGDQTLFASGKEVLASWKVVDTLLAAWAEDSNGLAAYEPGANSNTIL